METGQNNFSGILATKLENIKKENNISYNSAFNHFILNEIISSEIKDEEISITEKNILDNPYDGGLDIGLIDESSNRIYLIQNKNYKIISPQQIEDSLNKLISYIEKVKNGDIYYYNENVKNFSNKLKVLLNNIENELLFKLIINTSAKINDSSQERIENITSIIKEKIFSILDKNKKISIDIEVNGQMELMAKYSMIYDEEGINDETKLHIKQTNITSRSSTLTIEEQETKSKSFLTVIDAVKFREFFRKLKDNGQLGSLYSKNVREYFKNKNVDNEIKKTLEYHPEDFFILNNGLTIIGKDIHIDGNVIKITNMCIINGAQTTYLIGESKIKDSELSKVSIFAKIIDINTFNNKNNFNEDEFINKISYASNNQKPIKKEDLITQNKVVINFVKIFNEMSKHTSNNYSIQLKKSEISKKELKKNNQEILTIPSIIKDSLKLLFLKPGASKSKYQLFINQDSISTDTRDTKSNVLWIFKFLNPKKDQNKFEYLCEFIAIKKSLTLACKQKILDLQNAMNSELNQEPSLNLLLLNELYRTGQSVLESLFIYSKIVLIKQNLKRIIKKDIKDIKTEYDNNELNEIIKKRINWDILNNQKEIQQNLSTIANAYLNILKEKLSNGKTIANVVKEDNIFSECALTFADQYLTDKNNIYGKDDKIKSFFYKLFNI